MLSGNGLLRRSLRFLVSFAIEIDWSLEVANDIIGGKCACNDGSEAQESWVTGRKDPVLITVVDPIFVISGLCVWPMTMNVLWN